MLAKHKKKQNKTKQNAKTNEKRMRNECKTEQTKTHIRRVFHPLIVDFAQTEVSVHQAALLSAAE